MRRTPLVGLVLLLLGLAACASEVVRRPTQLAPVVEGAGGTIVVQIDRN